MRRGEPGEFRVSNLRRRRRDDLRSSEAFGRGEINSGADFWRWSLGFGESREMSMRLRRRRR